MAKYFNLLNHFIKYDLCQINNHMKMLLLLHNAILIKNYAYGT